MLQSLKRHKTVCHPTDEDDQDDPLAFQLCLCCGEPSDSAHTVSICFKIFLCKANLFIVVSVQSKLLKCYFVGF